jgi:S1-C subfamily serine protease
VYLEVGYRCGGSLGKLLLGLKVVVPNRRTYLFRETIGKLASAATFGVGFALVFTKDRLAMHDYMAKTSVVVRSVPFKASQAVAVVALAAFATLVAYRWTIAARQDSPAGEISHNDDFIQRVTKQMAAVGTVYTFGRSGVAIGQGSAFVLSADGLAATNVHVLEGAFRADCRLGDGRLFNVLAVQGFNAGQDVAIFQLGRKIGDRVELPSALAAVRLGSSSGVKMGDRVATISSPKGLSNTVSDGLVSSIRQEGERRLIQTTAPISSGSSGAPLFNTKGEVIGLTTLQMREGQNLNFAVPIENVTDLLQSRDDLPLAEFQARLTPPKPKPSARPPLTMRDMFQSANTAFKTGHYFEALKGYERAQELDPTESAAYYNAARCYLELGDSTKAARMYYIYLLLANDNDPDRQGVIRWLSDRKFPIPQK